MAITAPINLSGTKDVLEGVNSQGLSFSLNMLPNSKLDDLDPQYYASSVPIAAIGEWALGQYATVKELKEIIPKPIFGHKSYYCYVTYQALSITHFMIKPVIVLLSKSLMVNYIFMIILPIA